MTITLYEFTSSRSARVRWTLLELGLLFEAKSGQEAYSSDEFGEISPLGKIPALKDGEKSLFESAAICTWLADSHPEKELSFASGTWERALHDQWVSFILTEVEAHIWSTFRNMLRYKEEYRVPEIIKQNNWEASRSLKVLEDHLSENDYMVGGKFSVTDIIAVYALNWAHLTNLVTEEMVGITSYIKRLSERPHCTLRSEPFTI